MTTSESFSKICREVCERQDWELLPSGVNVDLGSGRHQVVSLEIFDHEGRGLVRAITTIGLVDQLSAARLVMALEVNASLPYGALAIRGGDLCMLDTLLLKRADSAELEVKIEFLAHHADHYEKILFGTDDH